MSLNVIHVFGASGSGTSTLGEEIAKAHEYYHMDTDNYFWLPTNPRFTKKRSIQERITMMEQDIKQHKKVVITGSLTDWGDVLIPYFNLVIRVVTETETRLKRLHNRELERFGARIEPGGDMYGQHLEFMEWAAAYDTGDIHTRSKCKHDDWEKLLTCRKLTVDGSLPLPELMKELDGILKGEDL